MIRLPVLVALAGLPAAAAAQTASPPTSGPTITLDRLEWRRVREGFEIARVEGNPSVPDVPYTVALRLADGAWIPPHWHPREKRILVISGTVLLGYGDAVDVSAVTHLPPGGFALVPARAHHYEGARGETVLMLYGIGPLATTFVGGGNE